jgi:hypothetical protein
VKQKPGRGGGAADFLNFGTWISHSGLHMIQEARDFTVSEGHGHPLVSCEGRWDGWDDYKACFYFGQGSQIGFYFGRVPHVQKILVMGKSKWLLLRGKKREKKL